MSIEQQIRRQTSTAADTKVEKPRNSAQGVTRPVTVRASAPDAKGSSMVTGTALDTRRRDTRRDVGSDWRGNQQKGMELRAVTTTVDEEDDPNLQGYLDLAEHNDFRLKLTRNVGIIFETSGADQWEGSDRGDNITARRFWCTLKVDHQMHYVVFPDEVEWPGMEEPDFTPLEGGRHVLTFMVDRIGIGEEAVQEITCISVLTNLGRVPKVNP